jgi:hypothetical protein
LNKSFRSLTVVKANVKRGYPLGILEQNRGRIYRVRLESGEEDAASKLMGYAGITIFAKGRVTRRGGVRLFTLSDGGKSVE